MSGDQRYYQSPVDYEAWGKGYMPPTEHVLMDALHRGVAKVSSSFRSRDDGLAWWFVFENEEKGISPKRAEVIRKLFEMDLEILVERFNEIAEKAEAIAVAASIRENENG